MGTDLDPATADPRTLMQELLPPARQAYIKAWSWLADAHHAPAERRAGRERALRGADDHATIISSIEQRLPRLEGDDLLNARHLMEQLTRLEHGLRRIAILSPLAVRTTEDVAPDAVGCGRRYRRPGDDHSRGPAGGRGRVGAAAPPPPSSPSHARTQRRDRGR